MPEIEKMHYHDEIFENAANYLRNDGIKVPELIEVLEDVSGIIGNYEKEAITRFSYDKNDPEIVDISKRLMRDVGSYLLHRNRVDRYHFNFRNTLKIIVNTVIKYKNEFFRNGNNDDSVIYHNLIEMSGRYNEFFVQEESDYLDNEAVRPTRKSINSKAAFMIVNGVIHALVKDINDIEIDWKIVNEFYRNKYAQEIENMKNNPLGINQIDNKPIIFLSYAFDDKTYTYFLFKDFYDHGAFLYVDEMFNVLHDDPNISASFDIKKSLYPWIRNANQFLFLRSVNSQRGNVRPWCAWEIGNFFSEPNKEAFKIEIYGVPTRLDKIIGDFKDFNNINNGIMY